MGGKKRKPLHFECVTRLGADGLECSGVPCRLACLAPRSQDELIYDLRAKKKKSLFFFIPAHLENISVKRRLFSFNPLHLFATGPGCSRLSSLVLLVLLASKHVFSGELMQPQCNTRRPAATKK